VAPAINSGRRSHNHRQSPGSGVRYPCLVPILTFRYVEPRDGLRHATLKAAISRLGRVMVMSEEKDDALLPAEVQRQLESSRGSLFGGTGPNVPLLANQTGVCFIDIEVGAQSDRDRIVSLLVSEGCAYFMTEESDDGTSRGFWWTPEGRDESEAEIDDFGNAVDPEGIPDLTALARRLRQPPA
jgi:hypothetical protein